MHRVQCSLCHHLRNGPAPRVALQTTIETRSFAELPTLLFIAMRARPGRRQLCPRLPVEEHA